MGLMTDAEATSILLLPNGQRRNLSNANKDLRAWIADKGYDSFVYPNWYESDGKLSYMVFNPNQIKSATGNVGTYNANNPDIRYSLITPEMDTADARQSLYDAPFFNDEDGEAIYFEDDETEHLRPM
jgi:hypothetical protein